MADKIDVVPESTRWEIATTGLTGAYTVRGDSHCEWVVERKK